MVAQSLFCLLPLLLAGATAAPHEKRTIETDRIVYAYGKGITGLPVYANADGLAVIGGNSSDTSKLSNATWNVDTTGSYAWNVTLNETETTNWYIIPGGDGYVQAGFTVNGTVPDGAVTSGFVQYGADMMFKSGDTYLSQFWAQSTSDGLWNIMWNANGDSEDGSVPLMLKPKSS